MKDKAKKRKERLRPTDKLDCLYRAACDYVESKGGKIAVIGGVSIMRWPTDRKLNFSIVLPCTGIAPKPPKAPE